MTPENRTVAIDEVFSLTIEHKQGGQPELWLYGCEYSAVVSDATKARELIDLLQQWIGGQQMTPGECEMRAYELLADIYTDDGRQKWMYSANKLLDGKRPADLIWEGEGERVLQIIGAIEAGGL